jgi:hypothetical protein
MNNNCDMAIPDSYMAFANHLPQAMQVIQGMHMADVQPMHVAATSLV